MGRAVGIDQGCETTTAASGVGGDRASRATPTSARRGVRPRRGGCGPERRRAQRPLGPEQLCGLGQDVPDEPGLRHLGAAGSVEDE